MQGLLTLPEHLGSPAVSGGVHAAHLFNFLWVFCIVLFYLCICVLFVFVLCLMCPMLPVSPHCSFLIPISVFSNVCSKAVKSPSIASSNYNILLS